MQKALKKLLRVEIIIILLSISFWPLSLFLENTLGDFTKYLIPAVLVGLSFLLIFKNCSFYLAPLLLIPFIEPKLSVLPLIAVIVSLAWRRNIKLHLVFILISLFILLFNWKAFSGQTIFQPDYEAQQEVIGKTYLYPNVFTARLFQNKVRIYLNKFNNNFFALTDPNNYFFGFHPREIKIDNQNLNKYPFLSIIFVLLGFYFLRKNAHWRFIIVVLLSLLFSLSILKIFDRNDFILWVPLSLVFAHGVKTFQTRKAAWKTIFYTTFLIFSITEMVRIFLR